MDVYNKVQAAHAISTEEEDICCSKLRHGRQEYNGVEIYFKQNKLIIITNKFSMMRFFTPW